MHCEQAQQLFDAYLNGELPPSLMTELGAHRLSCADCRRDLALLEVTGHIITSTEDQQQLSNNFTSRLLSCMDEPRNNTWLAWRKRLYVAGPMAAAAVVVLAFLGVFDHSQGEVAGRLEHNPAFVRILDGSSPLGDGLTTSSASPNQKLSSSPKVLGEWMNRTQAELETKQKSGESLQNALDMTILQLLDILEQSKSSLNDAPPAKPKKPATQDADVEDM